MTVATTQPRVCSIARTLEIVGSRGALLAVREVFLGNRRFDEIVRRTGVPRDTLAARLRVLVAAGILERVPYCGHPARFEYHLTQSGLDLYPVILALMSWGDRYLAGDAGPPLVLEHECGHRLGAEMTCEGCGETVTPGGTRPASARSAPQPVASKLARRGGRVRGSELTRRPALSRRSAVALGDVHPGVGLGTLGD
jgi:DNA-binding HxlR family transcriptional regulator